MKVCCGGGAVLFEGANVEGQRVREGEGRGFLCIRLTGNGFLL